MIFLSDKLLGMIVCGVFAAILVILVICAIVSQVNAKKKPQPQPAKKEVSKKATPVEEDEEDEEETPAVVAAPVDDSTEEESEEESEEAAEEPAEEESEEEPEEAAEEPTEEESEEETEEAAEEPTEEESEEESEEETEEPTEDESEEESEEETEELAEESEEESEEEIEEPAEEESEEETEEPAEEESEEDPEEETEEPAEELEEESEEETEEPVEEESEEESEEEIEEPAEEESGEETEEPAEEESEEETEEPTEEESEEESEEETEEPTEEESNEEPEEKEHAVDEALLAAEQAEVKPNASTGRYAGKYIINVDGAGQYRFKLIASNGQQLIASEAYTTESGCRKGIDTIKRNVSVGRVKIDADKHNLYFFTLTSKQNRILAQSASYKSKDSAIRASESFKKFALTENIVFDEENVDKTASDVEIANVDFEVKEGGYYSIEQDNHGFIYVLKASNKVKIVTSQDYSSHSAAKDAYERFKDAVYNGEWQIVKDKNGNFQFKLYLRHRLVVAGELYQSKDQVKSTIASIKSWAQKAEYEESKPEEEE